MVGIAHPTKYSPVGSVAIHPTAKATDTLWESYYKLTYNTLISLINHRSPSLMRLYCTKSFSS